MNPTPTPLYIIIGAIAGIISATILAIFYLPQVIQIVRSFLKWSHHWLRHMRFKFNNWRWWRQYRPSWRIANYEDLKIKFNGNEYSLELQVDIEYRNGSDRYNVDYIGSYMELDLYHEGKGWEKQPYHFSSSGKSGKLTLKPAQSKQVNYVFENSMSIKPLIENTATCKIVREVPGAMGYKTPYISLCGKLKREGSSKFKVNAIWDTRDNSTT